MERKKSQTGIANPPNRCTARYQGARCRLHKDHPGRHEAEFPRYHCHVDAEGNVTPEVEHPFRWPLFKESELNYPPGVPHNERPQ